MKYLTVCRGALLALSLAVVSTSAAAGDSDRGPAASSGRWSRDCYNCPPRRKYNSQEVVRQTKDVDRSRVIKTESVVPSKRLVETNHLIVRENGTSQRWYGSARPYHHRERARSDEAER